MKGLIIIGGNTDQIAKKATETHSVRANVVDLLKLETETLCLRLKK